MLPEPPLFIIDSSDEVASQLSQAFSRAEIRNPVERFTSVESCLERLRSCSRGNLPSSSLCPVLILLSVGLSGELAPLQNFLRADDRFAPVPLVLHGNVEALPGKLPEGVRSTLPLPPRLDSLVKMVSNSGAQWILRIPE